MLVTGDLKQCFHSVDFQYRLNSGSGYHSISCDRVHSMGSGTLAYQLLPVTVFSLIDSGVKRVCTDERPGKHFGSGCNSHYH